MMMIFLEMQQNLNPDNIKNVYFYSKQTIYYLFISSSNTFLILKKKENDLIRRICFRIPLVPKNQQYKLNHKAVWNKKIIANNVQKNRI